MALHNLPRQSTSFVGRNKELTEIGALLDDPACQLVTLLGPGGIGKTRLALEVAANQLPKFADGVYFVALSPIGSPDLLSSAIASAIAISFYGTEDRNTQIVRYLREKQLLLVMDNFEHLLDGVDLLTDIVQVASGVKILVTSRERLNLQEEWIFAVDGLSTPLDKVNEPLESYSGVQLFVQRARQVQTNFSLSENAEAVKTICQRLEGMPLGLELAATWLRVMACRQIAAQIGNSLDFLTTPLRNIPERHRSLRMVFEQSWRFLSTDEQTVLMKLSVFRGGFDRDAAEQVTGASLLVLAALVDKSLIRLNTSDSGRYDLHEVLRQYAADKLSDAGEVNATIQRHLVYFLKLAEEAEAHQFGREQIAWFDRLEIEFDNLRAALTWSTESEIGLRLATALSWFFEERAHWIEGFDWLERMLMAQEDAPISLRAKALHSAGMLSSQPNQQRVLFEQAVTLARAANDNWNVAWALSHLGFRVIVRESIDQSAATLEESLSLFRELENPMGLSHVLTRRAVVAVAQRDYSYVSALIDEAWIYAHEAGDKIIMGWVKFLQGEVYFLQNHDFKQAKSCYEYALSVFSEAKLPVGVSLSLITTAFAEYAMGDNANAQTHFEEALILVHEIDIWIKDALAGLASVAKAQGRFLHAARLWGAADNNDVWDIAKRHLQTVNYEHEFASLSAQLGEIAFSEAWAAGKAMTKEQAVAYVLESRIMPVEVVNDLDITQPQKSTNPIMIEALSAREIEVLRLIADGLSNGEIAQKLFLTVGTVKVHSRNIYGKLGANNRTQAVTQAQKFNLL